MKRLSLLLALTLVVIMVFATGCGSSAPTPAAPAKSSEAPKAEAPKPSAPKAESAKPTAAAKAEAPKAAAKPASNLPAIKIGLQLPLTGAGQGLGLDAIDGVRLGIEQINQRTINGRKVETVDRDTKSDPQTAVAQAQEFIGNKDIVGFIGGNLSIEALPVKPVAMQGKIPFLGFPANPQFTATPNDWVFQANVNSILEMQTVLEYTAKGAKAKRVAILHANDGFGQGGRDALVAEAPKYGVEVVAKEQFGREDTDMTPQLTKIKSTNPDLIMIWGITPRPEIATKNARQLGMTQKIVAASATVISVFKQVSGDAAVDVVFPVTYVDGYPHRDVGKKFAADFKAKFNRGDTQTAAIGYSLTLALEQALQKAMKPDGSVDRQGLRDAFESVKVETPIGTISYSKDKHAGLTLDNMIMGKITKDGAGVEWEAKNR